MDTEETFNTISNLISKFVGKNNWIFLISVAAASATGLYFHNKFPDTWWLISIFVLCCGIVSLNIITSVVTKISSAIIGIINKKKEQARNNKLQENKLRLEKHNIELRKAEKASEIWTLVEYADIKMIDNATILLNLPVSDGNPLVRFLAAAKDTFSQEYDNCNKIHQAASHFNYQNANVQLIRILHHNYGYFVGINEYFYTLLCHYAKTGKWEKI